MTEEEKPTTSKTAPKQTGPQFIPKLKGKKVIIRLTSGGHFFEGIFYVVKEMWLSGKVSLLTWYVEWVKNSFDHNSIVGRV